MPAGVADKSSGWPIHLVVTVQDGVDPYAGMSERERKLAELQARLRQSRKANQNAVIAERRREKVRPIGCYTGISPLRRASGRCGALDLWMSHVKKHRLQACRAAAQLSSYHPHRGEYSTVPHTSKNAQLGDEKTHQNSKRKWFDEKQKRLAEELERRGLSEKEKHRLETAEVC